MQMFEVVMTTDVCGEVVDNTLVTTHEYANAVRDILAEQRPGETLINRSADVFVWTCGVGLSERVFSIIEIDDDSNECQGHESLDGAHMGESVYCDGSCR